MLAWTGMGRSARTSIYTVSLRQVFVWHAFVLVSCCTANTLACWLRIDSAPLYYWFHLFITSTNWANVYQPVYTIKCYIVAKSRLYLAHAPPDKSDRAQWHGCVRVCVNGKNPLLISFKLFCSHCNIFGTVPVFLPSPHICARKSLALSAEDNLFGKLLMFIFNAVIGYALRCVSLAWIKQTNGHFGCACEWTVRLYTYRYYREAHTEEILTLEIYILFSRSTPHSECYLFRFPYRTLYYMLLFLIGWLPLSMWLCSADHRHIYHVIEIRM